MPFKMFNGMEIWLHIIMVALRHERSRMRFSGIFYEERMNTEMVIMFNTGAGMSIFINPDGDPLTEIDKKVIDVKAEKKKAEENKMRMYS